MQTTTTCLPGRIARCVALLLVLAVAGPASAQASSVSLSGATLVITGGPEASDIGFGFTFGYGIRDRAGISAGAGCTQVSSIEASCGWSFTRVEAQLGDGDDTFRQGAVYDQPSVVSGGGGNDTLNGSEESDTISGGDGNDTVWAGGGNDTIDGGPGDDSLNASGGDDRVTGGPGRDSIHGDGNDVLDDGNDVIEIRDGVSDVVDCGLGADVVTSDAIDVVDASTCDRIDASAGPGPEPTPTPTPSDSDSNRPILGSFSRARLGTLLGGHYRFDCSFPSAGTMEATLEISGSQARRLGLGRRGLTLARAKGPIEAGDYRVWLRVKSARYRRALRRAKRVAADIFVGVTDASGETVYAYKGVTFRR